MAIDERHMIDPHTGFAVDKETGVPLGLVGKPHLPVSARGEFPKWVTPHASHVVNHGGHTVVPGFAEHHESRGDRAVTVLVKDAEEEAKALAAKFDPKAEEAKVEEAAEVEAGKDPGPT
jgi:hypothetical protein